MADTDRETVVETVTPSAPLIEGSLRDAKDAAETTQTTIVPHQKKHDSTPRTVQAYALLILRYIGIALLLTVQVSIGVVYVFILSSLEFVLVLVYAGFKLAHFCRSKFSPTVVEVPVDEKAHAN